MTEESNDRTKSMVDKINSFKQGSPTPPPKKQMPISPGRTPLNPFKDDVHGKPQEIAAEYAAKHDVKPTRGHKSKSYYRNEIDKIICETGPYAVGYLRDVLKGLVKPDKDKMECAKFFTVHNVGQPTQKVQEVPVSPEQQELIEKLDRLKGKPVESDDRPPTSPSQ